ncbi:hypothetical protein HGA91_03415 [candidate division WWE3 bacterium]|nr:hypothetical protein [candidate division WWE3 bacterium]
MSGLLGNLLSEGFLTLAASVIGAVVTFFKSFRFIQEGELGLKVRFGKVVRDRSGTPRVIHPGFVFLIPWIDSLPRRHVRQQTLRFEEQRILLPNGLTFIVSATVLFRVVDIYKALFEIDDLEASLSDFCMAILRDELSSYHDYGQLAQTEQVSESLILRIKEQANQWGVEFIAFRLTNCAPASESSVLISTEIGAKLRIQAIAAAAVSLGYQVEQLSPTLASVLVGIPMVTSIGQDQAIRVVHTSVQGNGSSDRELDQE